MPDSMQTVRNGCEHNERMAMTRDIEIFDEAERIDLAGMLPEEFSTRFKDCVRLLVHVPSDMVVGVARVRDDERFYNEFRTRFPDFAENEEEFMIEYRPRTVPQETVLTESVHKRDPHTPDVNRK